MVISVRAMVAVDSDVDARGERHQHVDGMGPPGAVAQLRDGDQLLRIRQPDPRRHARLARARADSNGKWTIRAWPQFQSSGARLRFRIIRAWPQLFQAFFRLWSPSGRLRMRRPVAAKIALSTAGAATAIVGSPTPPQTLPPEG